MPTAFKEWQVICDALASGRQSILLRKGGIHEGRAGFSFAHDSFFLLPTKFHAQAEHVREGGLQPEQEWQEGDLFTITHHSHALFAVTLTDWAQLEALFPYHVYTEQTLRDRFDWEGKGMASGSIHVAFVRVSKLEKPLELVYEKRLGGCRSWVELPAAAEASAESLVPVLGQDTLATVYDKVREIINIGVSR